MAHFKRYAVLGGAGYIGAHMVDALCSLGHEVFVFDNFSTGQRENLHPDAFVTTGDIRDPYDIWRFFQTFHNPLEETSNLDCVFHFAGLKAAGESMLDATEFTEVNINGTNNVLNAMIANDVKSIVFSSSAAVYGIPEYLPITEEHPTDPTSYYGYTKKVIEDTLQWYNEIHDLRYAALRYFNAAGYDDTSLHIKRPEIGPTNLLPVVMETATGKRDKVQVFGDDYRTHDGTGVRDYIHVVDLVNAHIRAAVTMQSLGQSMVLNLGAEVGYSVLDVVNKAREVTNRVIPVEIVGRREGDVGEVVASRHLAGTVLGWRPNNSHLETILGSMWSIYE